MNKNKIILAVIVGLALISAIVLGASKHNEGSVGAFNTSGVAEKGTYKLYTLLNATTTTATSAPINIAGAKKVTLFFTRANHSAGSSAFSVTVSGDDSTYITYNKLIDNVTNTNAQTLTRVASKSLAADGSATVTMDLTSDNFLGMKCVVTETTDGTHTCKVLVEY